jgi:hypothetical protein
VLAQDYLASSEINLAYGAGSVAFVPLPGKAKKVDIEARGAVHISDVEDRACVPEWIGHTYLIFT